MTEKGNNKRHGNKKVKANSQIKDETLQLGKMYSASGE